MQLGAALAAIQPGLDGLLRSYGEGVRQVEEVEANAAAEEAGRRAHVATWAEAVRENPALADRSPYFRRIYEGRLARTAVQRQANSALAEWAQSDVASSTDPNAIQEWLGQRFAGTLERFSGSDAARAAATDELRRQAQQLSQTHTERAVRNLVTRNQDSFNASVGSMFDQAAQRGFGNEWMAGEMERITAEARAQGIDGRTINQVLIAQTEEAMVRHGRADLGELGRVRRPDGTPGFGETAEGRAAIERARGRIASRAMQADAAVYTRLQRQRAEAERNAHIAVADSLFTQMQAGQEPSLSPEVLRQLARVDPVLAGRAMEMVNQASNFARRDDPLAVIALEAGLDRGVTDGDGILAAAFDRRISPQTFQRLYGQWRTIRQDGVLNDGAVTRVIDDARNLVGDPSQMGGIFRRPQEAAALGMQLRQQLIDWRSQNRTATLGETVEFLQKEVERLVPIYAPGMNLERLRLENVQRDGLPRRGAQQAQAEGQQQQAQQTPAQAAAQAAAPGPAAQARPAASQGSPQQAQPQAPQPASITAALSSSRPSIPPQVMALVFPPPTDGAPPMSATPLRFPEGGIRRLPDPTGMGLDGPVPYTPNNAGTGANERQMGVHVVALLRGLRESPDDIELIRDFDNRYGANAAHHFVQQFNRALSTR
jgi:hypothetical protein